LTDFKAKIQVLIHYKCLDNELNLLFRGKVAQCFASIDKILMTELIFSGILKELTNEELAAIFSVLDT
jgi:superfamily II RNA helicase